MYQKKSPKYLAHGHIKSPLSVPYNIKICYVAPENIALRFAPENCTHQKLNTACRQKLTKYIRGFVSLAFFPGSKQNIPIDPPKITLTKKKLKPFTVLKQK